MSLTSYRAAPPRAKCVRLVRVRRLRVSGGGVSGAGSVSCRGNAGLDRMACDGRVWRRPTLPCLETQYHGRWRV
jgi:hypothetical protein